MEEMNGKDLEEENIEIVSKPLDRKREERKAQRQAAKNQMYDYYIMVHLLCLLQQEVKDVEVEVLMDILQIILDMNITMILWL